MSTRSVQGVNCVLGREEIVRGGGVEAPARRPGENSWQITRVQRKLPTRPRDVKYKRNGGGSVDRDSPDDGKVRKELVCTHEDVLNNLERCVCVCFLNGGLSGTLDFFFRFD